LLLRALVSAPKKVSQPLELVWDPLTESLEAFPCAECGRPTFALELRGSQIVCPACAARPAVSSRHR
jgi:DNA-directed RNA polymerase subunit RPC12/RpoP